MSAGPAGRGGGAQVVALRLVDRDGERERLTLTRNRLIQQLARQLAILSLDSGLLTLRRCLSGHGLGEAQVEISGS